MIQWIIPLIHLDHARLADGRDGLNFLQDVRGNLIVHVGDADSFFQPWVASKIEIGDIDAAASKYCAQAADDARHVLITDEEDHAAQRRFNVHVIHPKKTKRIGRPDHSQNRRRSGFGTE